MTTEIIAAPQKVGILGGTFNPIHNGHIHLARAFASRLALDRVLLMPTQTPPHKSASGLLKAPMRLEMCRLAAEETENLEACGIELERPGPSYTADTLRELTRRLPRARLFFLMGADMFLTLEKWHDFRTIAALADLCAAARHPGETERLARCAALMKEKYGARCHVEEIPVLEISSTDVRGLLASGGDVGDLIPRAVEKYIRARGLYGCAPDCRI